MNIVAIILLVGTCAATGQSGDFVVISGAPRNSSDTAIQTAILPDSVCRMLATKHHMSSVRTIASFSDSMNRRVHFLYGEYDGKTFHEESMFVVLWDSTNGMLDDGKFSLPGHEYDYLDTLVCVARVFYGHCTSQFPHSVIWYQNELMQVGGWHRNYYVVDYSSGRFVEKAMPESSMSLDEISSNVDHQRCFELPGIDIHDEP